MPRGSPFVRRNHEIARQRVLQLSIFQKSPAAQSGRNPGKGVEEDFISALARRSPFSTAHRDCIRMETKCPTLRIRFDVLHFVNSSSEYSTGTVVAGKGRHK